MAEASGTTPAGYDHHRGRVPLLRRTSVFRTAFFVAANLGGFMAANAFLNYLATGSWLDFSLGGYRKSLVTPLNEMMLHPLSIFAYPWMIVVSGLLVAAVVFVPVMVALLYRLRTSMLFVLAVLVLAHAPLMAICLAAGCILAAKTRLRSDLPFLALLLGLFPVTVYLALFAFRSDHVLRPLQRAAILLPFVLALAAALAGGAAVLKLARLAKFRPGVIWPVLLIIVGAPIWLFYQKVGQGELDYALIAARVRPGGELFVPEGVRDYRRWLPAAQPGLEGHAGSSAEQGGGQAAPAELLRLCGVFLKRHPGHPREASVMWLRAAALEAQIRRRAAGAGRLWAASAPTSAPAVDPALAELHRAMTRAWEDLADEHRDSPPTMVADARRGVEALRDGRFHRALVHLRQARKRLTAHLEGGGTEARADGGGRVFAPPAPMPGDEYYRAVRADVDRLIWLMSENKVAEGSQRNRDAFREYMKSWPFTDASRADLGALAAGYEGTELAGNFGFLAAMAEERDLDRAMALRPLAEEVDDRDAAIAATYQLGRLAMKLERRPAWRVMKLKTAREYFKIVRETVQNPYQGRAGEHLQWLQRQGQRRR